MAGRSVGLGGIDWSAAGADEREAVRLLLAREKREQEKLRQLKVDNEQRVKEATQSVYHWVTNFTETYNEHWDVEGRPSPYEPFPRLPYFPVLFDVFDSQRVTWILKSRDLMVSWACVAYLTFQAMTVPERGVLFQCQTQEKVIQLVDYAKCLWRRQPLWLREAFPLVKDLDSQASLSLEFKQGGGVYGLCGGANKIRSYHPYAYLNDESSFQADAGDCYNEALAAAKGKIIFNSSAGPGWYADARNDQFVNRQE